MWTKKKYTCTPSYPRVDSYRGTLKMCFTRAYNEGCRYLLLAARASIYRTGGDEELYIQPRAVFMEVSCRAQFEPAEEGAGARRAVRQGRRNALLEDLGTCRHFLPRSRFPFPVTRGSLSGLHTVLAAIVGFDVD